MNDPYSILGIYSDATDEEVKAAYRNMARKYHPDNYDDDNPLKELAKEKMQEINAAYDEIQRMRASASSKGSSGSYSGSASGIYVEIRQKINARRYREAEALLASVSEYDRTADWHFLTAMCLMQRGRVNDAMRELELACSMDPSNQEYQRAKEQFNGRTNAYGSTYYGDGQQRGYRQRSASSDACDCCSNLICMDCCCEIMGGDLIPCL